VEPFLEISHDEQEKILDGMDEKKKHMIQRAMAHHKKNLEESDAELAEMTAEERWRSIDKDLRYMLQRFTNSEFIRQLETVLIEFMQHSEAEKDMAALPLLVNVPDGMLRMVAHAAARFYQLQSASVDYKGDRITVISKPRIYRFPNSRMPRPNCALLSAYLDRNFLAKQKDSDPVQDALMADLRLATAAQQPADKYFSIIWTDAYRREFIDFQKSCAAKRTKHYRESRSRQGRKQQRPRK
jgi:hypothetical protein